MRMARSRAFMRAQLKHPRNQRPGKPDGGEDARDKNGREDQQAKTIRDQLESFHGDTNVKGRRAFFKASRCPCRPVLESVQEVQ